MADSSNNTLNLEQELAGLRAEYKLALPGKIEKVEQLWDEIINGSKTTEHINDFYRMVHSIAGSSGTYGAFSVTGACRKLLDAINSILDKKEIPLDSHSAISYLISELKSVALSWQPSAVPFNELLEFNLNRKKSGNLIYLVQDDELNAKDLTAQLEKMGFKVNHLSAKNKFRDAFNEEVPAVIILDTVCDEAGKACLDKISELSQHIEAFPPVIVISARNDIEARLAAVNAGAQRYLHKPYDVNKLEKILNGLIHRADIKPYRVLFVDDDIDTLKYYKAVMTSAGIESKTISNPLKCLDILNKFKPDVIVLDVYMSACTGLQLAQVIRQYDKWANTPIMFLSVEYDINIQLDAMQLGAESFMTKPVNPNHLKSAVTAKAKQSRWTNRLNNELRKKVRESEYQIIASNQHDIISTADVSGRIISVNDKFCHISGYSRDELLGKNHRVLKSSKQDKQFFRDMWTTISSGAVWHGTICNLTKQGEEYWVESTIVPFLDDNGIPYKYVSVRTDITALMESEERLERSQTFANIGTWDWNINTGNLFWSERIWPLFGYNKKDTDTTYDNFMNAIHPDDRDSVTQAITNCIENEEDYDIEHRVVWPDGSIHWLQESGDVVRDSQGKALQMLGVVQDITKRKLAEEEIIIAREEAESANRAKSEFLSSMSHELRTPMNAIMGFGQLLSLEINNPLTVNQKENVYEILKASEHLLELINEVLDLAKIEAGRIDLSIEDVCLGSVIVESLQLIMPLAEKRGISIKIYNGDNEVGVNELKSNSYHIRADHTRTKQVIINLLSNAVKYNVENGKIIIKYETHGDHTIRVSVTDTGEGLTKEQSKQLFTAFNRLGAENSEIEGSGIGLVITKNIIELMGGNIDFVSQPGEGSTFWFDLPDCSKSSTDINDASETLEGVNLELKDTSTVLYIEDNPANLRLVTQLLGRLPNVHMWSAHEPNLGIEIALEKIPDLILLDINLPGINGFEVLERLRNTNTTSKIPVIAISANAMPKDIEKGIAAGFDDYITKPININALLLAVGKMLDKKS